MDIKDIIKRVRKSCDYDSEAAIARALGMSPQNFLSQKKSGGIKDSLILHAIEKGINPDWVKTGEGEMRQGEKINSLNPDIATVIHAVTDIMYSGQSEIIDALVKNVQEFKRATETAKRLNACEIELKDLKDEVSGLKSQIDRLTAPPTGADAKAV